MSFVKTKDGTNISTRIGNGAAGWSFPTAGRSGADAWDAQMLFSASRAIASSPTTGAAHGRSDQTWTATTWTPTPTIWRR